MIVQIANKNAAKIKACYDESDIVDNKISLDTSLGTITGLIVKNNNTSSTLTITINDIEIILDSKNVDINNIPNDYKFYGIFEAFTEIGISGTSPDFDLCVEG